MDNNSAPCVNIGEEDLRCEYLIRIFGEGADALTIAGAFDLPRVLRPGFSLTYLCHLQPFFEGFIKEPAVRAFEEICQASAGASSKDASATPEPSGATRAAQPPGKPAATGWGVESKIRCFGKNVEVFTQEGGFHMPGSLSLAEHYRHHFHKLLDTLVVKPAYTNLREFMDARFSAAEKEQNLRARQANEDPNSWNFGSEHLLAQMEQAEAKAA